jgi:hypothetical protein
MSDYNGWTNRETWLISLYLGDYFQEVAEEGEQVIADYIEKTVSDLLNEANIPALFQDMIDIAAVNWQELAEHYTTDDLEG